MATAMKRCRVCGKEYEACRSAFRGDGVFRWREVACSPEHGAIYLAQVNAARGIIAQEPEQAPAAPVVSDAGSPKKQGRKKSAAKQAADGE